VKFFSKTLHVSAPSLPRDNSSTDLPSELPAKLLTIPSSGSVGAAWFHPFSRSLTAPMQSCAAAPAPSPSETGRGMRWLLSAALRLARPRTPDLAAYVAAADRQARAQAGLAATKRVSFSDPLVSSPSSSLAPQCDSPGTVFLPGEEVSACPGLTAPSQPPQTRYPSR
jgi:hypothetical protein